MQQYLYTGTGSRTYADYVDESTGRMLTAEPGGQYEIRAPWPVLPVPPADGWWEEVQPVTEAEAAEVPKAKRGGARPPEGGTE